MSKLRISALLLGLALATACARAIDVGSEPRPVFRIAVANEMAEAMIVSYSDARGTALLGTVPPGRTEHFTIAAPATSVVSVSARNAAGTRQAGPYSVELIPGESVPVRLRN